MRLLHAPQHMGDGLEKNLDTILKLKPLIAHLTEQDAGNRDNIARIRARVGHKYFVCAAPASANHSREIVVLFRRGVGRKVQNFSVTQVSKDLNDDKGVGNDRHMAVLRWHTPFWGDCADIVTHWNAAIQDKKTGARSNNARAQAMHNEAGPELEDLLQELANEGRRITGSADFNYRDFGKSREWKYAPVNILRRQKQSVKVQGLDYVWWSKLFRLIWSRVIPVGTGGNHSDHPWILVRLGKPIKVGRKAPR